VYKAGKFAARHKLAIVAAVLLIVSLAGGVASTIHRPGSPKNGRGTPKACGR